ncbi:PIG-L family deacetylase [Methylomonas sp. LL1]|uniref:PIG-L deacetylase family protein n=1 Tax=Methylomonas sp. LL1 TaxID=2785785 RepID=UPI0018C42841|nr:PIG-L deacetylase family protein [Methylomonas sp. LL1]QPK63129.1 PIG-L family deacetylase [Methylomonas sp. LL1]CAG1022529.1 N-acetyl-alpha-D-glucosaminyl L-malate deacetylase 1 [Methylococcales bacterium]
MKHVIVVAPHPDDETLGCGGTLLKHRQAGDQIHWLLLTAMTPERGFTEQRISAREAEIAEVSRRYGFASVNALGFPTARLDAIAKGDLIAEIAGVFQTVKPEVVYLPFRGDVHSDHAVAADAVMSCCKWFRNASVKRILAYETLSETEFGISPDTQGFRPNVFVDIGAYLEQKLDMLHIFDGELGEFPFPRSDDAVCALARFRGAASGCQAAEAFMLLREII